MSRPNKFKSTEFAINKLLKYFVYMLKQDIRIEFTRETAHLFIKEIGKFDGRIYIKKTYKVYRNNRMFMHPVKNVFELLKLMLLLKTEIEDEVNAEKEIEKALELTKKVAREIKK